MYLRSMNRDEIFMQRAIELAQLADARVYPNPYVGAVIVHNEQIIAEGYHQKYGEAHAEVNAVNAVHDKSILKHCTIYVTLEPCAHFGKTPPCADLIVQHQFKRVVVGAKDPFALVNGAGISRMKDAGIEVKYGVLEAACNALNKRFFTYHREKRPYIVLKWAESVDGFIAPALQQKGQSVKITGDLAHLRVHEQRAQEHAILVGRKTIELDNPQLNVRGIKAPSPTRFVIDPELNLGADFHVFQDGQATHILNLKKDASQGAIQFHQLANLQPQTMCDKLYELGILSVYIEGGAFTLQQFIDANLWDEAFRFVGKLGLLTGVEAPRIAANSYQSELMENDTLAYYVHANKGIQ